MVLHLLSCLFIIKHFTFATSPHSSVAISLTLSLVFYLVFFPFFSFASHFLLSLSSSYSLSFSLWHPSSCTSYILIEIYCLWTGDHDQISSPPSDLISIDPSFDDDVIGGCCKIANCLCLKVGLFQQFVSISVFLWCAHTYTWQFDFLAFLRLFPSIFFTESSVQLCVICFTLFQSFVTRFRGSNHTRHIKFVLAVA